MSDNDWRYLTLGLMGSGVVLRSCSQPWGRRGFSAGCSRGSGSRTAAVCARGDAALAPNSKGTLSSAALPRAGLQNPAADTARSVVPAPRPEGWAGTDFISCSTFPSFLIPVLSDSSLRSFAATGESWGLLASLNCLCETLTERLPEG